MKITATLFLPVLLLVSAISVAQQRAVTETGEEVILYKDGTWVLANPSEEEVPMSTNPLPIKTSERATFQVKSTAVPIGVWLDPKTWKFKKGKPEEAAEFSFSNGDLYALLITESISIPMESWPEIALANAADAAPDARIVKREMRNVNGVDVLLMQLDATISGIKLSYYGLYYSSDKGSVQFLTYTGQDVLKKRVREMEQLLSGFVEL